MSSSAGSASPATTLPSIHEMFPGVPPPPPPPPPPKTRPTPSPLTPPPPPRTRRRKPAQQRSIHPPSGTERERESSGPRTRAPVEFKCKRESGLEQAPSLKLNLVSPTRAG
ncbi:hypothetical protein JR316_0005440 [Psilocybe cubensis]|uniref:Uncharacterized protein n=1 Tax=Psilocybe cubensis TaxID=181762 RepID=A0ACB8H821_PSICU|nr:hypothetical protein JR316_0005440 [Psilocybe cubensis]KAH9483334.1 hypothetical protein JR316_0005440 [Psilocybe cubensis]